MSDRELIELTAATLPEHVKFWLDYNDHFFKHPPPNILQGPYRRMGTLGWAGLARYELADDEALLLTVENGGARYLGIQATDDWMIAPSPRKYLSSYNPTQTTVNPDGSSTYILSVAEPGYANWIETGGSPRGWLLLRWQGVSADIKSGDELVNNVSLVKLKDLPKLLPETLPKISAPARQAQRAERDAQWLMRVAH